jgi:hypothetical protein
MKEINTCIIIDLDFEDGRRTLPTKFAALKGSLLAQSRVLSLIRRPRREVSILQ